MEVSIHCGSNRINCRAEAHVLSVPGLDDWPCLTMKFVGDSLIDQVVVHFASLDQIKDFQEHIAKAIAGLVATENHEAELNITCELASSTI